MVFNRQGRCFKPFSKSLMILLIMTTINLPLMSQTNLDCEAEIELAQEEYTFGSFNGAKRRLEICLNSSGLSKELIIKIYRLLGYIYLAQNLAEEGESQIKKLLTIAPDYTFDTINDTPEYIRLVKKVQALFAPKKPKSVAGSLKKSKSKGSKKWWYIGGSALAAGAVVAVLLGGGGEKEKDKPSVLPRPPATPPISNR